MPTATRHILSLSGGKDSTALAVYLKDRIPEMEYVFCDTRKELPETYEYLDKVEAFESLLSEAGVEPSHAAYVGDDVVDIPLMRRCALAVAVADATPDTRAAAHYVTRAPGGFGAVREVCELILKAQGRWDELLRRYLA